MISSASLTSLAQKISNDYIAVIKDTLGEAKANLLLVVPVIDIKEEVINDLNNFFNTVNSYADHSKQVLLPYLESLNKKVGEQHNCSNCSGKCHVKHTLRLTEIEHWHDVLQKQIDKVEDKLTIQPNLANTLYSEVLYMVSSLKEKIANLIKMENEILIPLIRDAQRKININAH